MTAILNGSQANEDMPDASTAVQVPKRRKIRNGLLVCLVVVSIGFGGWYLYREFLRPAEGTIRVLAPKTDRSNLEAPPQLTRYEKKYFSVTLSETYQDQKRDTLSVNGTTLREQAYFSDSTGSLRKVAVTIDEQPGLMPEDLSSYAYRHTHPEIYREKKLTYRGQDIVIFEKWDSVYEIIAYFPRDNRFVASIALVSASETPDRLIGDFSEILNLFEWV